VLRARLAHLNVEDRGRPDVIDPRIAFEHAQFQTRGFVKGFGAREAIDDERGIGESVTRAQ
jgi:hypothetical protein